MERAEFENVCSVFLRATIKPWCYSKLNIWHQSEMSLLVCHYQIFSFKIFNPVIFQWFWFGLLLYMDNKCTTQMFFRTASLQERVTEYLGLFSFILHFEYYSSELEDFIGFLVFLSTAPAPGKSYEAPPSIFRSTCPFSSSFFFPCQIWFANWLWQNEHSISPCLSFDWHKLFCLLLTKP